MKNSIIKLAGITASLLLIPFVGTLFNAEMLWTPFDFAFAGALIFGAGMAYIFISNKTGTKAYKWAVGTALSAIFLLLWINGAVGIIGSENNPLNMLYFAVPAVLIIGSLMARLKSLNMFKVLLITAFVQAMVPIVALFIGRPPIESAENILNILRVLCISGFFALMFLGSALLFRQSQK